MSKVLPMSQRRKSPSSSQAGDDLLLTRFYSATIQFSGRRACDGKTVVQQLVFNPGLLQVPFNFGFAEFSSDFNCLSRVDVELIQAEISTSSALATVMLDSMKYDAHLADYSCSSCVSSISSS